MYTTYMPDTENMEDYHTHPKRTRAQFIFMSDHIICIRNNLKEHCSEQSNQAHNEGVLNLWGVCTTKEYHSLEFQLSVS